LDQAAAKCRAVVVDDGDRDLANELPEIGLRIEHAVKHRSDNKHAEDAAIGEHAAPFADKGADNAAALLRQRAVFFTPGLRRQRAQPPPREHNRPSAIPARNRESRRRGVYRRPARRVVKQEELIPAQRQQCAPGLEKPFMARIGMPTPGKAEGRRRDNRNEAQTQGKIAD
jgi:hypothetical protein